MSNFNEQFLKKMIEDKGLRPRWVAERVGISAESFFAYMRGVREPKKPVVKLLSVLFGVKEEDFYHSKEAS